MISLSDADDFFVLYPASSSASSTPARKKEVLQSSEVQMITTKVGFVAEPIINKEQPNSTEVDPKQQLAGLVTQIQYPDINCSLEISSAESSYSTSESSIQPSHDGNVEDGVKDVEELMGVLGTMRGLKFPPLLFKKEEDVNMKDAESEGRECFYHFAQIHLEMDPERTETDEERTETDLEKVGDWATDALKQFTVSNISNDFAQEEPLAEAPQAPTSHSRKRKHRSSRSHAHKSNKKRKAGDSVPSGARKFEKFLLRAIKHNQTPWWQPSKKIAEKLELNNQSLRRYWTNLTGATWPAGHDILFKGVFDPNDSQLLKIRKIYDEKIIDIIKMNTAIK